MSDKAKELAEWTDSHVEFLTELAAELDAPPAAAIDGARVLAIAAELTRLAEVERALQRFRADRERLLARIEFAAQPIGNCSHCLVGNKPGEHHLPDCPSYRGAKDKGE